MVASHESTGQRVEYCFNYRTRRHIAGKGFTSMTHNNLAHGCKSRSGQGTEEARDDSSMEFGKSQEQKGCYSGSTKRLK